MSVPIRVRLTVWYAALLATTIVALGTFLVLQLRADLHQAIDEEVRIGSIDLARAVADDAQDDDPHPEDLAEDFTDAARAVLAPSAAGAQLLDARGHVLARFGAVAERGPMVSDTVLAAGVAGPPQTLTATPREQGPRYRIRVASIRYRGEPCVLVLGESLQPVEDAVRRLLMLLVIAGPSTLGLTALAAYWLAYKALQPVERMTTDAQEIGIARLHERVALPTSRDEIHRLAVTLNAMLERIEVGLKEKHQLVADASHELRTPLAVMRSEIDVTLKADELSPAERDALASVRDEVDRMTRTIDNLLALAQADEGRLELLTVRIDLRRLAEDTVGALRPLATEKGVSLTVAGDSWEIQADPQRLRLVLINLIENAIKFSPADGTVRISTWRRDGEVGVTVTDDGPGVPLADREHLFDRFYRVSDPHLPETGGSGLGLAICREVAVAHGGRIWVDSGPGGGSAFTLALPSWRSLQENRPPAAAGDDHPAAGSVDTANGSGPIPPHTGPASSGG